MKSLLRSIKKRVRKDPRPSLNDLDRKLEKYLSYRDGFFIEAGANDGYTQSNTYYLEKKLGWHGVLIEGIPDLFAKCQRERSKATVHHCALVAGDYSEPTVKMHYAHLMSVVDGSMKTSDAQDAHLQAGVEVQNLDGSYTIQVPARTLESILDETPDLPPIDFFSLDVEGYELNVLRGLNLAKHRPKYLLVEARFFDDVNDFVTSHDYELVDKLTFHDVLYRCKRAA